MVTFAGSGANSANNLGQAKFDNLAGITTTYVPFSGTGPSMTAILGRQTTAGFNDATSGVNVGEDLRMLVVSSDERLPAFPDVPTFKDLGYNRAGGASDRKRTRMNSSHKCASRMPTYASKKKIQQ